MEESVMGFNRVKAVGLNVTGFYGHNSKKLQTALGSDIPPVAF